MNMSKKKTKEELIKELIESDNFTDEMDELIEKLIDEPISFDVDKESDRGLSFGDKAADKITAVAGSWAFIIVFSVFFFFFFFLNFLDDSKLLLGSRSAQSVSVYLVEPDVIVFGGIAGANYYDESEQTEPKRFAEKSV